MTDHPIEQFVPRPRGGENEREHCLPASDAANAKKGNRLPRETGLQLLSLARPPNRMPVTAPARDLHGNSAWNTLRISEREGRRASGRKLPEKMGREAARPLEVKT